MSRRKPKVPTVPTTYDTTLPAAPGHPPPVAVSIERPAGTAQLCLLRVVGVDQQHLIHLHHEAAYALWAQLGPIVRDARIELAVLEAMAADDKARGIDREARP